MQISFQVFDVILQNFVLFSEILMDIATGSKVWKKLLLKSEETLMENIRGSD